MIRQKKTLRESEAVFIIWIYKLKTDLGSFGKWFDTKTKAAFSLQLVVVNNMQLQKVFELFLIKNLENLQKGNLTWCKAHLPEEHHRLKTIWLDKIVIG